MSLYTADLPETLATVAREAWQNVLDRADQSVAGQLQAEIANGPIAEQLPRVFACSPFVAELSRRKFGVLYYLLWNPLFDKLTRVIIEKVRRSGGEGAAMFECWLCTMSMFLGHTSPQALARGGARKRGESVRERRPSTVMVLTTGAESLPFSYQCRL